MEKAGGRGNEALVADLEMVLDRFRSLADAAEQDKKASLTVHSDDLACVLAAQQQVYEHMRQKYYQSFVLGEFYGR